MLDRSVKGSNVTIRAYHIDGYHPFACATSVQFNATDEILDITGPESGRFTEHISRRASWSINLSSLTHIKPPDTGGLTVFDTLTENLRTKGLDIELMFADEEGNIKTITGHVIIPNTSISAEPGGFSEDEQELKGSGPYTIGTTILNPTTELDVQTLNLEGNGLGPTVSSNSLIGANVIAVFRGGQFYKKTVNPPGPLEFRFNSGTGSIEFSETVELGEPIFLFYNP